MHERAGELLDRHPGFSSNLVTGLSALTEVLGLGVRDSEEPALCPRVLDEPYGPWVRHRLENTMRNRYAERKIVA